MSYFVRFEPTSSLLTGGNARPQVHGPFPSRVRARAFRARMIRAEKVIEPRLTVDACGWGMLVWSDAHNGCPETRGEGRYIIAESKP